MKKISLLLTLMLSCVISYSATVSGIVTNASSQPVANLTIYIIDSTVTVPPVGYSANMNTNAVGAYSFTIPGTVAVGNWLQVYTMTCGMVYSQTIQYSGSNTTVNFSVCGGGLLMDTTSGFVHYVGASPAVNTPAYPAVVYLIERDTDTVNNSYMLTLIDSTNTDTNGMYQFVYPAGSNPPYLVKAALSPANADYASVLPTYFDSSLTWDLATPVNNLGIVDVFMISGTNPGGPGFIGGSVLQGANKTTAVGDPLSKRIIVLTNMSGMPVAYTYSDGSGNFGFSNLAYGTYHLFGDAPGKTHPILTVTISATHPSVSNVVFEENNKTFKGHIGSNSVNDIAVKELFIVYPNPVNDQVNISHLDQVKGAKTIKLMSMTGSVLFNCTTEKQSLTLPVNQLAPGIYSLIINSDEGTAVYTISK